MNSHSLNHIYRLVWNAVTQSWVAVAETTRGKSKPGRARRASTRSLALATALMAAGAAQADPAGGVVTSGVGRISQSANSTVIQQQSQNLQLQWQSFNVGAGQSVTFQQPGASALAVNQILDTNGSRILGNINANGQVWLINPNGVYFGKDAQVNVGGLVASTLNPMGTAADGSQSFAKLAGSATGSVVNEGKLTAAEGGYIALLGEQVRNQGVISAQLGTVALAGGSAVSLNFGGHQLLGVEVTQSTLDNLASNQQLVQANGGQVFMSAGAKNSLLASAVNNSGTIEAQTIQEKDGRIILLSGMAAGTTTVGGKLDASAPNGGKGGFIETSASVVKVASEALVTTQAAQGRSGTWLLDPTDFNIEAGAGASTSSSIGADTLSASLASGNVKIQTDNVNGTGDGDINVNAAVNWATDNTLTLSAYRNVAINADITATGANGKLALETAQGQTGFTTTPGRLVIGLTPNQGFAAKVNLQAGNNFSLKTSASGVAREYKVVTSLGAEGVSTNDGSLQGLLYASAPAYIVLGADIDASSTSTWNGGSGFRPITAFEGSVPIFVGQSPDRTGEFHGLGHTITGLTINRPTTDKVGLFSNITAMFISTVGLVNGSIKGANHVGALAGQMTDGSVGFTYSSATVVGKSLVGGLVGGSSGSGMVNNYATGDVTGLGGGSNVGAIGGLVGLFTGRTTPGFMSGGYASGKVSGTDVQNVGGLVGLSASVIMNSYATGDVSVSGATSKAVGGLIGAISGGATNVYSTGNVSSADSSTEIGGLVGKDLSGFSRLTDSFWNTETSGQSTSAAGVGKTTAELKQLSTYQNWTSTGTGNAYPTLVYNPWGQSWQIGPLPTLVAYTLSDITSGHTYSGNGVSLSSLWGSASIFGNTYSDWVLGTDYSFSYSGNAVTSFTNAGTYSGIGVNVLKAGFAPAKTGNTAGSLVIAKKDVNLALGSVSKTYDGTTAYTVQTADLNALSAQLVGSDKVTAATVAFTDKNAGQANKSVTLDSVTISDGTSGGNYNVVSKSGNSTSTITPKAVTVSGITAADKTYDGSTSATVNTAGAVYTGLVVGEALSTTATGVFADKNASDAPKTVALTASTTAVDANTLLSNYDVTEQTSTTASITRRALTITAAAQDKVYDGTTTASVALLSSDKLAGDDLAYSVTSADFIRRGGGSIKDVGTNLLVFLNGVNLGGADSGNYRISPFSTLPRASITPRPVTVSGLTADDKVYDGSTQATVNTAHAVYTGLVAGEALSTAATGSFASKNASPTAQVVSLAATTTAGANTSLRNYTVTEQASTSARITPKAVTVSGITAADKTYDGSTSATVNTAGAVYTGLVAGEALITTATGVFADKNASDAPKTVALTASTTAGDATTLLGNYSVTEQTSATASINRKLLTVTATAQNKVYDGTAMASVALSSADKVAGDDLVYSKTRADFTFLKATPNPNVGTNRQVFVEGVSLSGADSGNYNLVSAFAAATASITPRPVTVSGLTVADKVYDGSTQATVNTANAVYTGLVQGEALSTTATGSFASKNASPTAQVLSLAATTTAGANTSLSNYTVTEQASTSARIAPKAVTVSGITAADKAYDGSTTATLNTTAAVQTGVLEGEELAISVTGAFASKNASATAQTVTLATIITAGANTSLANYTVTEQASISARITPKAVTVSGLTVADKAYDGSTAATVNTAGAVYTGLVAGEALSTTASGSFASKDAGASAQVVSLVATTTAGANTKLSNYAITEQASATAQLNKRAVTVSGLSIADKTYDGSTALTVNTAGAVYSGLVAGESLVTSATGAYADKNAGANKAVVLTATTTAGANTLLGNYAVTEQTSATGTIQKKVLTVAATAADKVYDSTPTAGVTLTPNGVIAGETVQVTQTAANFVDAQGVANGNVGSNKSVVVQGVGLAGNDSANYALGGVVQVDGKASITPATLTYVAAPASFILGQPLQLTGSVTGLMGSDTLASAFTGTATWTVDGDLNLPGAKGVVGGGLIAKAGNYVFTQSQGNGAALELKPGSAPLPVQAATSNLQRGQGSLPTQLTTGHTSQGPAASAYLPPVLSTTPGWGTLQVIDRGLHLPNNLLVRTGE